MFHKLTPKMPGVAHLWRGAAGTAQFMPLNQQGGNAGTASAASCLDLISNQHLAIPSRGNNFAFRAFGGPGSYTGLIQGNSVSGDSFGLWISSGTVAGDQALNITNQANTVNFLIVKGNGQSVFNHTTNGTAVYGSAGVTVLDGTNSYIEIANGTKSLLFGADAGTPFMGVYSNHSLDIRVNNVPTYNINGAGTSANLQCPIANCVNFIGSKDTGTGTGMLWLQAGGGSDTYGGTIALMGGANASTFNGQSGGGVWIAMANAGSGPIAMGVGGNPTSIDSLYFCINRQPAASIQGRGPNNGMTDMTPDQGTFTGSLTGYAANLSPACTWYRIGKVVTLFIAGTTGTSTTTAMTMTGLPAAIQPTHSQDVPCTLEDNTAVCLGNAIFTAASGTITFQKFASPNFSSTGFTASGTKGIPQTTITYTLV